MRKKIVSLLVMVTLVFSFTGCSSVKTDEKDSKSTDKMKQYKAELQEGVDNLSNSDSNYIISNILESPDGTTCYLENFSTAGESYTEYPLDSDGNIGNLNVSDNSDISYQVTDWLTEDGKMYLNMSQDKSKDNFYVLPDSYANICKSRNVMYVDTMLNDFTSIIKEDERQEVDLGDKDKVKLTMYKCVLPSDKVKNYLAVGSIALYKTLKEDTNTSDNVKKLCDYYLEDLNETMYFSDANVYLGLDANKILRSYSLEVGGLGTRLYLTKAVLYGAYQEEKTPDFSEVKPYSDTLVDLADYLAESGKDYGEAINELYKDGEQLDGIKESIVTEGSNSESSKN